MRTPEEIAAVLKRLNSAVIFTHTRPDGDAIGCGMALSRALSLIGIQNQVVNDSEIPQNFLFLPDTDQIRRVPTIDAEGYICVDSSDENRLGELQKLFLRGRKHGKVTVNIDHHISNTRFCEYNFVRGRSSNCENVADVIAAMGVKQDEKIASYLLAGIVTDTGGFSHSDVNGGTFRAAASAVDAGADVNAITYHIFKKQTKTRAELYAYTISNLRFLLDDRLAVAYVSQEMLARYALKADATTGIVDFALTIDTVEVSVCVMEVKRGQYKVSFRSKGKVDVNGVAGVFGGGGHILASGCMLFGEPEEVYDKLCSAVRRYME